MTVAAVMTHRHFLRSLFALVIPIALQNLLAALVLSADILMLGLVGQSAMAAVSLAGQVTFFLSLFYFGLAMGVGIMTAQYWGKGDKGSIEIVLSFAQGLSTGISAIAFVTTLVAPQATMGLLTNDPQLIHYGSLFLQTVAPSYLAMGLSQMYLSAMRSMEKARFSAVVSSVGLLVTIGLDALIILVLFPGRHDLAILGVGVATSIARFVELIVCGIHSRTQNGLRTHWRKRSQEGAQLQRDYLRFTLPVLGNFLVWGGALTATAGVMGHASADMVAANSVASALRNLAIVICTGIASGGAVLVGKYLGAGDMSGAKKSGDWILLYATGFGVLACLSLLMTSPLVLDSVQLTETASNILSGMLLISSFYCIAKALNSTIIGGIFPAGGDPRFGFWIDTIVMWGLTIPLSVLAGFVWKWPALALYLVISMDEFLKLPVALARYRRYRWLNQITR